MKNGIGCIYNSTYSGRIKDLNPKYKHSLKPATLSKDSNNFHKITEDNIISTSGEQPLLLYRKKESKISHSFDYKMTKKNSDKNIFISDGGLKLKNEKFNSGYNYTNSNINQNNKQIKSLRTYLESININKLLKTPAMKYKKQSKTNTINSKKNIPNDEHVFYKTVRGSSNRPVFQKKIYNIEKHSYRTGEGFGLRTKIEMQNNYKLKKNLKNINKFEESKKTEENKIELMDSLIKRALNNNFFIIQKEEKKINPNEILVNKKKEYLKRNGIGVSDVNLDENDEDEKQNEKDEIKAMSKTANNFNHVKLNNYVKIPTGFSPKQKNYYMTLNNETHFLNNNSYKNKKPNKLIVDQFEYIKKINKHKRLCTHENLSKKERDKLFLKYNKDSQNNPILNDSFRHKNNINNKYIKTEPQILTKKNNSIEKAYLHKKKKKENPSSLIDVNNDEWPYSHKRSYRSPNELNKFVKEKKLQNKKKANNDEIQKNTKLFKKFKNLYNLNYQHININKIPQEREKEKINDKISETMYSTKFSITNKSIKAKPNSSAGFKKRKELNEYFLGNESIIKNESTLIDPNEYYLNVLESQQLLVNSGLNKIENESDEEADEISDNNDENNNNENTNKEIKDEFNTSKEQIQKIIKKESKKEKAHTINTNTNLNYFKNNLNLPKNIIKTNTINKNKITSNKKNKSKSKEIEKEKEKTLNPKNIIMLVEVLKFIIQRKVFIIIYQYYISHALYQHYYIAFTYFIAICKNKTFKKLEEYCNYKSSTYAFRKLGLPYIRRSFRTFVNNCYFKKKIEFLIILLSKLFKYKILEKIFIYSEIMGGVEEEKHFELVILKIMKTIFKPHLQISFDKLKNYNKEKVIPKKEEKELIIEKKVIKKDEKTGQIRQEKPPMGIKQITKKEKLNEKKNENSKEKEKEEEKLEEKYKKINKRYLEYSPTHNNKAKSYLYETFSDHSSFSINQRKLNSLDNDKWHQIQTKMELAKYILMNNEFEDEEDIDDNSYYNKYKKFNYPQNNSFNSKKSESFNKSNEKIKENKADNLKIKKDKNEIKKDKTEDIKDKINKNKKEKIKKNDDKKEINKDNTDISNNTKIKENENNNENKINKDNNKNIKNDIKKDEENKNEQENKKIIKDSKKPKEDRIQNELNKEKEKEKKNEEDEKIIINKIENDTKSEEKKKIKKNNENIINAPSKEEKINEPEISLDIQHKNSEIDISAERDIENSIEWEYNLSSSKTKSPNSENLKKEQYIEEEIKGINNLNDDKISNINMKNSDKEEKHDLIEKDEIEEDKKIPSKKNKILKKDKKVFNESEDEYLDEFEDLDINSDSEKEIDGKNIKNIKPKKEKEEEEKKADNIKEKIDKSRNINSEKEIKINENEKKISKPSTIKIEPSEVYNKIRNKEQFSNDLTDLILKQILSSEITSDKIKLVPHKSFKYELFTNFNESQSNLSASGGSNGNNINKELGLLGLNQFSLNDDLSSLNDSIMSSYSAFSVFNRTIKDKKKEHSLNLYYKKIAPRLIKLIKEEIYLKYPRIYANISMPLKNNSISLMMSLSLQDADMLRDNYKCVLMKENIKNIIDKEKILKKFEPINKQIRSKDNLTSDNFYDNILNECLVDTAIELINRERLYGENGDPLVWSSRTHELVFKYKENDPKKLAKYVCSNLFKTLHARIGLITENYDYLNAEQINNERDKRLIDNIKTELDEDEYQWRNLEMEETQLKVEIAELIMDQLYNENIEILEHIQYSRNRPDLYQHKSIYACEEIPKLSFQQTTTENAAKDKEDGDDLINV